MCDMCEIYTKGFGVMHDRHEALYRHGKIREDSRIAMVLFCGLEFLFL